MAHLDKVVELSGSTMSCAKAVRMACHNVYTQGGEYTTVSIVKTLVLSVLVSFTSDTITHNPFIVHHN